MNPFLNTAIEAARIGGKILTEGLISQERRTVDRKRQFDYVTDIDHRSEEAILTFIREQHPGHSILAEESGGKTEDWDYLWIVDPLDGTKNYIHQFPIFGVSIALMHKGRPLIGAILDPTRNELFHAESGSGAFLNSRPIHVSETTDFSSFLVGTGFPFRAKHLTDRYFQGFMELFAQVSDMRRAGAACLDLAYLACGRLDGFWEITLNLWDIAAGALIISEAGGRVTDIWGGNRHLETGHIVATNGHNHSQITDKLGRIFKDLQ
ncbi:inositol monophosphatase [bacterium]|nr:inositol monophosphatase [bacterium]